MVLQFLVVCKVSLEDSIALMTILFSKHNNFRVWKDFRHDAIKIKNQKSEVIFLISFMNYFERVLADGSIGMHSQNSLSKSNQDCAKVK